MRGRHWAAFTGFKRLLLFIKRLAVHFFVFSICHFLSSQYVFFCNLLNVSHFPPFLMISTRKSFSKTPPLKLFCKFLFIYPNVIYHSPQLTHCMLAYKYIFFHPRKISSPSPAAPPRMVEGPGVRAQCLRLQRFAGRRLVDVVGGPSPDTLGSGGGGGL